MTDIVCYWSRTARCWIVYAVDAEGNQLWGAEFYANASALKAGFVPKYK